MIITLSSPNQKSTQSLIAENLVTAVQNARRCVLYCCYYLACPAMFNFVMLAFALISECREQSWINCNWYVITFFHVNTVEAFVTA